MKTGALNDLGIYCVYPAVDLFGMPEEIIPSQHFLYTGADGCGSAVFKYSDKLVTITYSKIGQSRGVSQIFGDLGTIAIGSISQTDNISLFNNNGEENVLVPDIDKKYHMGNEAQSAVEFIKNPHSELLKECQKINLWVLRCMEKMRV
jgi:predicted dehydrogenase